VKGHKSRYFSPDVATFFSAEAVEAIEKNKSDRTGAATLFR
jgi:hypothetical protein